MSIPCVTPISFDHRYTLLVHVMEKVIDKDIRIWSHILRKAICRFTAVFGLGWTCGSGSAGIDFVMLKYVILVIGKKGLI